MKLKRRIKSKLLIGFIIIAVGVLYLPIRVSTYSVVAQSTSPCDAGPCGENANCVDYGDGSYSCECESGFEGDPYSGCYLPGEEPGESTDCQLGEWSECSVECGGGIQTREVIVPPTGTGAPCGAVIQECNTEPCTGDVDCEMSEWSICSVLCGEGIQYRIIEVPAQGNGLPCGETEQVCIMGPCENPCGINATFIDSDQGQYECVCEEPYTGNPYEEGCLECLEEFPDCEPYEVPPPPDEGKDPPPLIPVTGVDVKNLPTYDLFLAFGLVIVGVTLLISKIEKKK